MKKFSACTSILVGKKASIDDSVMIGRNEDAKAAWPKHLVVHKRGELKKQFKSKETGLQLTLPIPSAKYTATPEWTDKYGLFEEDGINEYHVAMSATESAYSNPLVLGYDPLVKNGLNEEAMVTVVLPFVTTAREGVQRLGDLIAKYGTGETNGVLFADDDEAWYFESGSGHYWVAERIPDDAYVVAANQLSIQNIDFTDHKNFMFHPGIKKFVNDHNLNPLSESFNFRKIFGTADRSDAIYSTPRVWYGHQTFSPQASKDENPESQELPFLMHAEHKLSIFDVQNFLGSHYQGTRFDPIGTDTNQEKHKYRPVSLAKTQESHILQMGRPGNHDIHWLAMGVTAESSFIPFYGEINDVPVAFKRGKLPASLSSAYWIFKHTGVLVDSNLHENLPILESVQTKIRAKCIKFVHNTDQQFTDKNFDITKVNGDFAKKILRDYQKLSLQLVTKMTDDSPLNFDTDENL